MKNKISNNMGIYVHIPFCVKKCNYCDFLSAPCDDATKEEYVKKIIQEIESSPYKNMPVDTIFFGGGTPSILEGEQIARIKRAIHKTFDVDINAECTIECNPGTADQMKLMAYYNAGFNRISIGLQATDNEDLKMLGRIHTTEDFLDTFMMARGEGFDNINVDIMSGLLYQSVEKWCATLESVAALKPEHISAYSLIVEENTPLKARLDREGYDCLPSEEDERLMYEKTRQILREKGYHQYEISNYARSYRECRHNLKYWERGEYLGFGIGAASFIQNTRYHNTTDLARYLSCENFADIMEDVEQLSREDAMAEYMFLGLRKTKGISTEEFRKCFQQEFDTVYKNVAEKFIRLGLLEREGEWLYLTEKGMDVSNTVMCEFLL